MAAKTPSDLLLQGVSDIYGRSEAGTSARTQKGIQDLFEQQQELMAPLLALQAQSAFSRGNQLAAQFNTQLGALGLGGTGVGALTRAAGTTLANQQIAQGRLQASLGGLQFASQAGLQQSLAILDSMTRIRTAEIGAEANQPSFFQQLMGGLGGAAAAASLFFDPSGTTAAGIGAGTGAIQD